MKTVDIKRTNEKTVNPKELILGVIDTSNYKITGEMMKMVGIREKVEKAEGILDLEDAEFDLLKRILNEYPNYQGVGAVDVLKRFES